MEHQTLGPVSGTSDCDTTPSSASDTGQGSTNMTDENDTSSERQESYPQKQLKLPIFQKIDDLSAKIQTLKKKHVVLSGEVKSITSDYLSNAEALKAFQTLSSKHELLKRRYFEECSKRKQLYNEVIELKGNIRVFCRCRPLNEKEIADGSTAVIDFNSSHENELTIVCPDSSKKQFKFDQVFKPDDSQETVFAQTLPIVTSVLDGYNVCIFAYGQTGTGKTFTMEGTPANRGVNYKTLEELFRMSEERSIIMRYELFVSMLEVYNEKIRDLLIDNSNQPIKKLEIKQAAEGTQDVPGLVEARVYSMSEVWKLLKSGSQVRSVGSTNANELSSRSHCLLRVTVMGENVVNGQRTRSYLWLVDLAGSERLGRIEVEGERLKESQFINKSLSALGDVISALASKTAHVPYRNSKLTHLLQSSLGGDCKALMFVQVSPSAADLGETLCSLNFASRVRGVEHGPARKQPELTELFKYKQMVEKLKHDEKETKKLQDNLRSLQLRLDVRDHVCRSLQEKVRDLENQLSKKRKSRVVEQETTAIAPDSTKSPTRRSAQMPILTEKKPPLAPSKQRPPLGGITNFLALPSPTAQYRTNTSNSLLASMDYKENMSRKKLVSNAKMLLEARRGSIAVRPPTTAQQAHKPRRRASMATLRPELNSRMATPPKTTFQMKNSHLMGRKSFVWDPQRMWRTSRVNSPSPGSDTLAASKSLATPTSNKSSRRIMGSPTVQACSSKSKHPTVALQRKAVVWSPMKLRALKNRKSLLPSR